MSGDPETLLLVAVFCLAGGFVGGIVGVGGGILFVPAMTIFLDFSQVEAESTSLLIIAIVCAAGAVRQRRYGNVNLRDSVWIALLSPVGVAVGVAVANVVPERALELGFAALALFMAVQLLRRTGRQAPPPEVAAAGPSGSEPSPSSQARS